MPTEKDYKFVNFLMEQTKEGKLQWEATAEENNFVASFKGKYQVFVRDLPAFYQLRLTDSSGRELLTLRSDEVQDVAELYHIVQRMSLNVDGAIDDIMGEPF